MRTFIKSLETLTQQIQENNSLDPLSFDLIQLANLSDDDLSKIKSEVKGIELIHMHEFWELTEEIYKRLMLKTIAQELQNYFEELQKTTEKSLEISYQFHPWKVFILNSSKSQETKLRLQTAYAEKQIQNLLSHLGIHDKTWINDLYDFDYKFNFESEVESRFRGIAFDCWKSSKSKTQSQLKACIKEENRRSHTYE